MASQKPTVCQVCGCNCGLLATLEGGRINKVEGDPENPQNRGGLCVKGKLSTRVLYAPDRITEPLIRQRGRRGFIPIGWDDALAEIAGRLHRIKEEYGPEALAVYRGRSGRFIDRTFAGAFARLYGTPNVTGVWTFCVGPKVIGYRATFGAPEFPMCDFRQAKLILLWGTNPASTRMHRYFGLPADIRAAVKRGAELVIIDPRHHRFAREATLHLPVTPGTDTYLILSLVKILVHRGWVDRQYVEAHTSGYDRLCRSLEDVDLAEAARKTGVSVESMENLARKLATVKPASIDRREGAIHVANGTQVNRALAILTAVTGNADVPGGLTFNPLPSWDSSLGIQGRVDAPSLWTGPFPLAADGSQTLTRAILEGRPYPVKAMISIAGNPVSSFPHTARTVAALRKLDFLVVDDLFMTETAREADLVLPGATFYEKGEFYSDPLKVGQWIQTTEPLVSPIGQARPEWRFMARLAELMDFPELSGFADEDQILTRVFRDSGRFDLDPASMRRGMLLSPMNYGTLLEKGFNTPSGKIELYSSLLSQNGYPPLPAAEDVCRCDAQYPYRLITGSRVEAFDHSQHRNVPELLKLCPAPTAEIPPRIADDLGLSEGDVAAIETKWGRVTMKVAVVEGMNATAVSIPHGWPGESNANRLIGDEVRDSVAGTPAYKAIPCRVVRVPV
jgi:anaerobic selenocysteine-containing dehydrogenase